MKDAFVPVSAPDIGALEEEYVVDAVRSSWISSSGRWVDQFEREFAQLCEAKHALSVCNGTASLHLALVGLGIGPGDEVIVPSFTYVASTNAVQYTGATPVFADASIDSWCIDPEAVAAAVTPRTRAIIAVHIYGHPCDMDALRAIAAAAGAYLIEDAAEAHFATYKGRTVGSLGDVASFSFYGNKIVTSGEGGALTCNDDELNSRLRLLRGQGMDPNRRYYFPVVGYNYRLTNVACAILCAQLERRKEILEARRTVYRAYSAQLSGIEGVGFQPATTDVSVAQWIFCITIDETQFGATREQVVAELSRRNIETRPFFFPNHRLPAYRSLPSASDTRMTNSIRLAETGLNLPTHAAVTEDVVGRIVEAIKATPGRARA